MKKRKGSSSEKDLDYKYILLISIIGNVSRTVWRKCILMLGFSESEHVAYSTGWAKVSTLPMTGPIL